MQKTNYILIRLTALLLAFLFILTPVALVFATDEPVVVETPSIDSETSIAETTTPEINPPDTALDDEISKDDEKEEKPEDPPIPMSLFSPSTPNLYPNADARTTPSMPQIDENTGSLIYNYPIIVPPGRNGLQPDLKLTYNSSSQEINDTFGSSWSINIPYIQRVNKKGSNNLYDSESDSYFYSSLDGELTLVSGSSYIAKTENGQFNTYTFSSNSWLVTTKNGTEYKFGYETATRQNNPSATSDVFKWMLQEVRDTNDNYIEYSYYKDAGQIYPDSITYTGSGSTDGIFEVDFVRSNSSYAIPSYDTGFSVTSNYYISEIDCKVNGTWVNKYELAYDESPASDKLLLNSITASGQDDGSNVISLPATTFAYQENEVGWTITSTYDFPSLPSGETNWLFPGVPPQFVDFNGDGRVDLLLGASHYDSGTIKKYYGYINTGSGWSLTTSWDFPSVPSGEDNWQYFGYYPIFTDVNGDGLSDVLLLASHYNSGTIYKYYTYLNTGSGWSATSTWDFPSLPSGENGWLWPTLPPYMADLNGDGLSDLVLGASHYDSGNVKKMYEWLNTGSGWTQTTSWDFPSLPSGEDGWQYFSYPSHFVDVNGDGLTDVFLLASHYSSGTIYKYYGYLNTGSGWSLTTIWDFPSLPSGEEAWGWPGTAPQFADLDGDGLMDMLLVASHYSSGTVKKYYEYLNTGSGWSITSAWDFPSVPSGEDGWNYFTYPPQFADLNSDGLADLNLLASHYNSGNIYKYYQYVNDGPKEDSLNIIEYPQGGETTVIYKNAAQYTSSESRNYPYPIFTVQQITNNDGASLNETTTYDYQGGQYYFNDAFDRKFSGYNYITKTDSASNLTKTFYHTGKGTSSSAGQYSDNGFKIGKVYRNEQYDNNSNLYKITINKWDHYGLSGGAGFVKIVRSTERDYDGGSNHKDKSETYTYDNANGNLTEKIQWGVVTSDNDGAITDSGSDKQTTSYAYTTSGPILLATVETVDQSSVRINQQKFYYDGQSLGTATDGNQTKVESWVTSTTYINSQKTYTSKGLVETATDPRSKVTEYTYDSYDLYPATVTNALYQDTDYTYNYANGKPTQITEPNGFIYQTSYDGFGRVKEEKIPGESSPYTPVSKATYSYTDTSNAFAIHKTDILDGSTAIETYQYFDGLGRLIQERKEDEVNSTYDIKDTVYNSRALVDKESLPYTSSGSSKTTATSTTSLYTIYAYDPLGRVTSITNAIGTATNTYDRWKTTITDLRSKTKDLYVDAYNNLIQVDEHNSSNTYTTAYEYDGNNKLTKIIDALSNVRNFTYDGLGRRLTAEDLHASGDDTFGSWTYTYDNTGNLTSVVNPNSQTINYTYDDINRILTEDYTGDAGTEVTYAYDSCTNGVGKLCTITATGANDSYLYNSRGNISTHVKNIDSTDYQTDYTYDRQGNQLEITNEDGSIIKYTYNTAGQLETVQRKEYTDGNFINVITDFDYGPDGQITYEAFANGATTTNTYDSTHLYRLSSKITAIASSENAQDLTYTYDNNGNITEIVDASDTDSSKTVDYTYDDLNRLTSATATNVADGQSTYTHSYTYDAIGNILTRTDASGAYSYDGDTGANYANPHAVTAIGTTTYTYDNNGNLTDNETWTNTWDYNNRLIESDDGTTDVSYAYDSIGQRVKLYNGTTTIYPTKYYNTDGTTIIKHIFANGAEVATITGSGESVTPRYVHTDTLTSSNAITNASDTLDETLDYFPFGNIRIDSGSYSDQRKYIGQEYDADTGLNYLNARYYDGNRGQFTSQDPVFWSTNQNLAEPQSLNSYSYANNNPITSFDPTGKYRQFSGDIILPGVSLGLGVQWDHSGLNLIYSFGIGMGTKISSPVSYANNNEELSHNFESHAVVGGSFVGGIGRDISLSGQIVNNTFVSDDNWQVSRVVGFGAGVYAKKEYTIPLTGEKPTNTAVGPAFLCSSDNIIQPNKNGALMISSPTSAGISNSPILTYSYSSNQLANIQMQLSLIKQITTLQSQLNQSKNSNTNSY